MNKIAILSILISWTLPTFAQEKAPAKAPNPTQFIRLHKTEDATKLQTGITSYTKDGITVDLIGAVHIGDTKYYKQLNQEFTKYDSLLFELIGNPTKEKTAKPSAEDFWERFLNRALVKTLGKFLKLDSQITSIPYNNPPKNFVHADFSLEEFNKRKAQKDKKASDAPKQESKLDELDNEESLVLTARLLSAIFSGDPNQRKLLLASILTKYNDETTNDQSVVIGDRNIKCLQILDQQLKAGKKKIGIFYGAGHFRDMEDRMLKAGYKKTSHRWLTAWDIPKAAKPKKKAAPADQKEHKKAA